MANLNFGVAINLLTGQFKQGANYLKNELKNIQMNTMAMVATFAGGAIGLDAFVSKLIDTAKAINKSETALKNVSGTSEQFAKNQKFLIGLSKTYGLNVNDLSSNFAKFTAAASNANMKIDEQYKLFNALSRASVAFGLSGDEANGVFLAVSQMMGKGKISAEELRGQLGERMPIAMQAMAKAAGVSVAQLDALMKQGKLTTEVLPKFADALNEMLPNVSTDNLQKSLGDLSNTFTDLTKKMNVEGIYKSIVDKLGTMFKWIIDNFTTVSSFVVSVITGIIIGKGINLLLAAVKNYERGALLAAKKIALENKVAFDEAGFAAKKFSNTASFAFKSLGASIKSAFAAFLPMLIVAGITAIIQKIVEWKKKEEEIGAIWTDYQKNIKNAGSTNEEVVKMQSLQRVMNNKLESHKNINSAQKELMSMLNLEKGSVKDINKAIEDKVKLLKEAAKTQLYTDTLVQAEKQTDDLSSSVGMSTTQIQKLVNSYVKNKVYENGMLSQGARNWQKDIAAEVRATGNNGVYDLDAIIEVVRKVGQINRTKNDAKRHIDASILNTKNIVGNDNNNNNTSTKLSPLQQTEADYEAQLKEYKNQLANNVIGQKTYNKLVDELNKKTYEKIGGMLSKDDAPKNSTYRKAKEGVLNPKFTKEDEAALQLDEAQVKYKNELEVLKNKKRLTNMTDDEYNDEMNKLIDSITETIISIQNIGTSGDAFVQEIQKGKTKKETKKERKDELKQYEYKSPFEDFGKDDIGLAESALEKAKKELDDLRQKAIETGADLTEALDIKLNNVTDLDGALHLLQAKKHVKELQKELGKGVYDGIKNIAGSARNVVDAWSNVNKVMESADASEWEKILSVWDAMTNTVDSFLSIIQMFENLTEITKALGVAKKTEAAIDTAVTSTKVANAGIGATAVVAAATTETAANTAVAGSGAAASVASVPVIGPILAIAAVAGIIGLLSSLPKFANGGIVGGASYSGDKILARLNSGEGVLTANGVNNLSALYNNRNGNSNSGGIVEYVIKGKDLHGVLKNFDSIKNKTK